MPPISKMPLTVRILILTWMIYCVGTIPSQTIEDTTGNFSRLVNDLMKKDNWEPVKIETRNLSLVHGYNDTEMLRRTNETTISGLSGEVGGGLLNNIENEGGIQKTVVVNNVRYSFYFWLMPKNYSVANLRRRRSIIRLLHRAPPFL